ncbi:MAG: hypothetical protein MI922_21235, partial [Bacteroidales bacterium]|nr:hypothetical protein [Bacteroidales bacterium]
DFSASKVQFFNPGNRNKSNSESKFAHHANSNVFSNYYKLLTEINSQNDLFQYSNALKLSNSLVQIVQTSADSFSHSEITKVWLTHLRVLIYNNKFQEASVLCRQLDETEAVRYDLVNEYLLLKWQLSFMTKDYNLSENLHAELGTLNNFSESEQCIISYFKLCLLFNEGEYEEVINHLVQKNSMQGTNSPIPHAAKLLEIYCYLELRKTDVANSKLMAFKQYLKRNNSLNKDRYQFIVKVLLKVIRSEYKYEAALQHYTKNEEESFANDCRFIPNYHRYEIIDFKGWLTSKCVPMEQNCYEKVKA